MLVVVSDTHSRMGHALTGRTLEAVREADVVVHAGDFVRESVLDAFLEEAETFYAVHGNADAAAVRERLPPARTVEYGGVRFAVTHTRDGGPTALSLFGRERGADVVVFGHSHRPTIDTSGPVTLLNPGSHAQPRGNRPGHAELVPVAGALQGTMLTPDGDTIATFTVSTED